MNKIAVIFVLIAISAFNCRSENNGQKPMQITKLLLPEACPDGPSSFVNQEIYLTIPQLESIKQWLAPDLYNEMVKLAKLLKHLRKKIKKNDFSDIAIYSAACGQYDYFTWTTCLPQSTTFAEYKKDDVSIIIVDDGLTNKDSQANGKTKWEFVFIRSDGFWKLHDVLESSEDCRSNKITKIDFRNRLKADIEWFQGELRRKSFLRLGIF